MIQPTKDVLQYIEHLYSGNKLNRLSYINSTMPAPGGDVIDDDVARFFRLLLLIKRPLHILEIGTSVGYSTVTMAQTVQAFGGHITTIEMDAITAETAQENFEKYGLADSIDLIIGDATEVLPKLAGPFDLIFMDVGDKSLYKALAEDCIQKLNPGGILVAEDPLYGAFGRKNKQQMPYSEEATIFSTLNDFNVLIAAHPFLESTLLPIGDGVTVAVRK